MLPRLREMALSAVQMWLAAPIFARTVIDGFVAIAEFQAEAISRPLIGHDPMCITDVLADPRKERVAVGPADHLRPRAATFDQRNDRNLFRSAPAIWPRLAALRSGFRADVRIRPPQPSRHCRRTCRRTPGRV